jgi:ribonuclease HI
MIYIYTDGASRNNPGRSASGYRILDDEHNLIVKNSFYNGIKTNNEAEYLAVIAALGKAAEELGYGIDIELYSDSQLVIRQLNGSYRVKEVALKALNAKALDAMRKFNSCKLESVPRENRHISLVDGELNALLDSIDD